MPVKVTHGFSDGNTVPYPPIHNHIQANHGFVDTLGRPDLVSDIPEAAASPALKELLLRFAMPGSMLRTLGCDLGHAELEDGPAAPGHVAGGYVQIVPSSELELSEEHAVLTGVGRRLEAELSSASRGPDWLVEILLCPVRLAWARTRERESLWIWFHARSSTGQHAIASRERLIDRLCQSMSSLDVSSAVRHRGFDGVDESRHTTGET